MISQVHCIYKVQRCHFLTTPKIYQLIITLQHSESINRRVPAIVTIFWEMLHLNTPQDFPAIIFPHQGIYFLMRVHNYIKIKDLESGKITSLTNSKKCDQLKCIISVITKNNPHAHHKTHLHTMKVVTILIPSFYGLR